MPVDYSKAKIYCIRSPNTELIYIGSTCQKLSQRMAGHREDLRRGRTITSKIILEYGDAYIELIENYPCNNKEELAKKEGEYIRSQNCCNIFIPDRTRKEYNNHHYETNKEKILEQNKQYREANKEALKEKQKQYIEANKEARSEQQKQYYEANKEAILERNRQYRATKTKERKSQAIAVA